MVPLKIALKNFLSYGQTTQYIDFEPYNLICLSGKNGHGKSALLDALTWVLWGYARKAQSGARADENLVRLGQTQMMVSLEFLCNGQLYRVRRELNISSSKVQTALDFGILDPQTGAIRGLTDKTLRATQEKIITTIGLDHESFINSVFLRQGASNEFSKKSPKERKEILSSMLGITQFELIKKKAIEKSRLLSTQRDTLLPIHQRLSCEITQKDTLVQALAAALEQEKIVHATQQQVQTELQQAELLLQQQSHDKLLLQQSMESAQKIALGIEQSLQELRSSRAEFKKILSKKINSSSPDIFHHELLEKELEQIHTHELKRIALQQESMRITQALQQQSATLQAAHVQKAHALDLQMQQTTLRICLHQKRCNELAEKIEFFQRDITKKVGSQTRTCSVTLYEKYREVYQKFVTQKNNLLARVQDYEYSIKKLSTQEVAECPTCTQELTPDKKITLCTAQHQQRAHAQHQLARFAKLLPVLKQTIITMHGELETLKEVAHIQKTGCRFRKRTNRDNRARKN